MKILVDLITLNELIQQDKDFPRFCSESWARAKAHKRAFRSLYCVGGDKRMADCVRDLAPHFVTSNSKFSVYKNLINPLRRAGGVISHHLYTEMGRQRYGLYNEVEAAGVVTQQQQEYHTPLEIYCGPIQK